MRPVPPERLSAPLLRARFAAPPAWTPEFVSDSLRLPDRKPMAASVLVALVARPAGLQVLLTRRSAHLRDHAGQISFPGGRQEPGDADATAAALREAHEEVGLHPRHVEVLGCLPIYATVTGFQITPVVGLVHPEFSLALDPSEVAEVFEVPLQFLMTPAHHQRHDASAPAAADPRLRRKQFLSMPWGPDGSQGGEPDPQRYFIWGATAAMLRNLYCFLAA